MKPWSFLELGFARTVEIGGQGSADPLTSNNFIAKLFGKLQSLLSIQYQARPAPRWTGRFMSRGFETTSFSMATPTRQTTSCQSKIRRRIRGVPASTSHDFPDCPSLTFTWIQFRPSSLASLLTNATSPGGRSITANLTIGTAIIRTGIRTVAISLAILLAETEERLKDG